TLPVGAGETRAERNILCGCWRPVEYKYIGFRLASQPALRERPFADTRRVLGHPCWHAAPRRRSAVLPARGRCRDPARPLEGRVLRLGRHGDSADVALRSAAAGRGPPGADVAGPGRPHGLVVPA